MKKVSTPVFHYKKLFPVAWFGFIAFLVFETINTGVTPAQWPWLAVPVLMAGYGVVFMRNTLSPLADAVYDGGDHLLFRKGRKEQRVNLEDILDIRHLDDRRMQRLELVVREHGPLGKNLVFIPRMTLDPHRTPQFANELFERVEQARDQ